MSIEYLIALDLLIIFTVVSNGSLSLEWRPNPIIPSTMISADSIAVHAFTADSVLRVDIGMRFRFFRIFQFINVSSLEIVFS